MKSKVAVLMATYNGLPYVKEQIDSIICQESIDIHIFISDDFSSDGTVNYIQELRQNNITILDNTNIKIGSAANNFFNLICNVDLTMFDYVALADQDDIWHKEKLIKAITLIEKENADCYSSGFCAYWENGKKKYFDKSPQLVRYDYLFSSPGPGCTYVLKKNIVVKLAQYISLNNLISKVQYHDWAVYAWVRSMNFNWIIDTNSYILYRQHSSNDTGVNYGIKAIRKRVSWIINGWYTTQIILVFDFIKYTCNFKNSVNCFKVSRLKFLTNSFSYRRNKIESIITLILILFNIINQNKIKKSISIIESK